MDTSATPQYDNVDASLRARQRLCVVIARLAKASRGNPNSRSEREFVAKIPQKQSVKTKETI